MLGLNKLALALGAFSLAWAHPVHHVRNAISGKYIVTLKPEADVGSHITWVNGIQARSLRRQNADSGITKSYAFKSFSGYAGAFDDATIEEIRNSAEVRRAQQFPPSCPSLSAINKTPRSPQWRRMPSGSSTS